MPPVEVSLRFPSPADRGASPTRGARWSIRTGRRPDMVTLPALAGQATAGLAQRRSQEGQGQGGTRRPRRRRGRATLPTEKLHLGRYRQEEWGRQKLAAAQDWRLGGVDDELVYVFARCCCRLPWKLLPANSRTTSWSCHRR
jgi:hypothetical protein